ncbi:CHAT domain-containing protein [Cellulophaga sp. Hel_I_12]|uniref:CHAT domain-containing protein n=1 Tax=Cellulophaga sp. Hel_I_12 TaxID=1249972 RepID=UPI000647E669|nr:CHAT domain-containing protein [Cellulophaga sp. Hel_I_12]
MTNKFRFLISCIFCILNAYSQTPELEQAYNNAFYYHYTNKDSAYHYYKKTIALANKQNELEYMLSGYLYLMNANGHYYDLKNYQKNLHAEDSLLKHDKRFESLENLSYYKDYLLFDKGNYHYKIKDYYSSKKYFQELFIKLSKIPEQERTSDNLATLSSLYSFLGVIYKHTGKYELAEYHLKKGSDLVIENKDSIADWETSMYSTQKLLSQVFEDKKDFLAANIILAEASTYYETKAKDPSFKNRLLSTNLFLAKNFIKQGKFQMAITTLQKNSPFYDKANPFSIEVDLIYGDAYVGLKEYAKAIDYYNEGLQNTSAYREHQKHQDIAEVYARLGSVYMLQKSTSRGLKNIQLALAQLEKDFDALDYNANPNPEKVLSKLSLTKILKEKLNALYEAYGQSKDIKYLKIAHKTSKAIIHTLDVLRPEFESKLDKEFLVKETYPTIQKMVKIAYELYEKTQDKIYVNDAFYFMEKSKSIALLEAQRNAEASKFGNIPEKTIRKEQLYRAKISQFDEEIFNAKQNAKSAVVDSLFMTKKKYYDYLATLENDYPKYYDLKYKASVISMADVQKELNSNQAIFSYLVAENSLFLISITKNKAEFYQLPFTESLKNSIIDFYRQLSKATLEDRNAFTKNSHLIYMAIVAPALKNNTATDITILADDVLNYIPFDVLQTKAENEKSYVLATYSISYASSATLLQEQHKTLLKKKNNLLVFAPNFGGASLKNKASQERFDMEPLLYNAQEAQNISNYFKTAIYEGNKASIPNFKKYVDTYNLIHFATHASANDEFPDYSYLAFENTDSISNLLYVKDLYNYTIDADLVTLSACQTGFGKLQKGEGMLSLARGFNYAGVPAIVTTLWKINDQSTSEIMDFFYKNLSKGLSKKEALRQAKLSYLEANDDAFLRHPYYWSGIVITGNSLPLHTTNYFLWAICAFIGLTLIWLVSKKLLKRR